MALFVDIAGGDADAAAAGGVLAGSGGNDAGAVGPEQASLAALHGAFHADHILNRNALGDSDCKIEPCINALEDGVSGIGWWDKNHRHASAGRLSRVRYGIKNRYFMGAVFEKLAALTWRDACDDLRAVVE